MKKGELHQITFTLIDGKVQTDISDDLIRLQIPFADLIKAKLIMDRIFTHYTKQLQYEKR